MGEQCFILYIHELVCVKFQSYFEVLFVSYTAGVNVGVPMATCYCLEITIIIVA